MTRDVLDQATRALADLGSEPAPQASATRARVLTELRGQRRRRIERRMFVLPAAAILLLGTAAAAANGSLGRAWHWVDATLSAPREPERAEATSATQPATGTAVAKLPEPTGATAPGETAAKSESPTPDPAGPSAQSDTQEALTAPKSPTATESATAPKSATATESATAPKEATALKKAAGKAPATRGTSSAAAAQRETAATAGGAPSSDVRPSSADPAAANLDPNHALYRDAHQAHFGARDYARALAAWDRYLKAVPAGRFALEARYNRAICLLHLGNTAAARHALQPFADGKFGAYRKDEATRLLDALAQRDAATVP